MSARVRLADIIDFQADACARQGSRLYGYLLRRIAEDVTVGGVCAPLLLGFANDRFAPAPVARLMAAVHRIVLEGRGPELAPFYGSVGGWYDPDPIGRRAPDLDPWPAFVEVLVRHEAEVAAHLDLPDQTNEVGRSPALLAGFLRIAEWCPQPMRLLEVGASAGLNLLWDLHRYETPLWSFGPPAAKVRFSQPWTEGPPPIVDSPIIASRRGCDLYPVDTATSSGRLTLRSFTWPDDRVRLRQLDRAIDLAQRMPLAIDADHGVRWLERQLAEPVPGEVTVVFHSMLTGSMSPLERDRLEALVTGAGARASADAPVAWLRLEPSCGSAEVRLTCFPQQRERVVARCAPHGPPVACVMPG